MRLRAMNLMALLCWMTMLKPNLLFMMARRHMMQTWMSSLLSPILSLVERRISLSIRGPSMSRLVPDIDFLETEPLADCWDYDYSELNRINFFLIHYY